jgi:FkbM family methyltransferase
MMHRIKTIITTFISNARAGRILSFIFSNQIPTFRYGVMKFDCSDSYIHPSMKSAIFWGLYEGSEIRFVNKYITTDFDVVELGGSIGIVASYIGKKLKGKKKIVSVEAFPSFAKIIERNLNVNHISQYKVIPKAIAANKGYVYFTNDLGLNITGVTSLTPTNDTIKVEATSLSDVLSENNISNYSLVVDIEGAEVELLLDDVKSLDTCNLLILETHETTYKGVKYTPNDITQLVLNAGFSLVESDGKNYVFKK